MKIEPKKRRQEAKGSVLLVDDEPHNVSWIVDHLNSLGYSVTVATNLNEALRELAETHYRLAVIDLNMPALEPLPKSLREKGEVFARFPGLYAAQFARNSGHRDRQTVLYSVHEDPDVRDWATRMRCTYMLKGRPKTFKDEIGLVLSYDPTQQQTKQSKRNR